MQPKAIITHLSGRISRNIVYWLLVTFYMEAGRKVLFPDFPALLLVMLVSYGIPGYIHNLWLIPRFLIRRRYMWYISLFAILLILTTIGSYYETRWINDLVPGLNYMGSLKDVAMPYHAFPSMLMFAMLAFGKFMTDAIQNQHRFEELEKQKLTSELESLRSQINPHFLFNALNTIYGMARRTDHETAGAVIQLSDILRHGLYECDDNEIGMDKEILFIRQYIEFTQLRMHDKEQIKLNITADVNYQKIAPLILIPFIENAIKHGLGKNPRDAWVDIRLTLAQNRLSFLCVNSNPGRSSAERNTAIYGGMGLRNVRRRLELLYPDRYDLQIINAKEQFSVSLKLQLA